MKEGGNGERREEGWDERGYEREEKKRMKGRRREREEKEGSEDTRVPGKLSDVIAQPKLLISVLLPGMIGLEAAE